MPQKENSYRPLVEALAEEESFIEKPMFGCLACYHRGRLKFLLADGDDPWNGILLATGRESHPSLRKEFPELDPHPVLGKWLYLPAERDAFERTALALALRAAADDPRIGVEPKERAPKKRPARSKALRGKKR